MNFWVKSTKRATFNFWTILNYIENLLNLAPMITGCVWISAFTYLAYIPAGTMSSAVELKICVITPAIKKYKSIIKKRKKKHAKIVLLANNWVK